MTQSEYLTRTLGILEAFWQALAEGDAPTPAARDALEALEKVREGAREAEDRLRHGQ